MHYKKEQRHLLSKPRQTIVVYICIAMPSAPGTNITSPELGDGGLLILHTEYAGVILFLVNHN